MNGIFTECVYVSVCVMICTADFLLLKSVFVQNEEGNAMENLIYSSISWVNCAGWFKIFSLHLLCFLHLSPSATTVSCWNTRVSRDIPTPLLPCRAVKMSGLYTLPPACYCCCCRDEVKGFNNSVFEHWVFTAEIGVGQQLFTPEGLRGNCISAVLQMATV